MENEYNLNPEEVNTILDIENEVKSEDAIDVDIQLQEVVEEEKELEAKSYVFQATPGMSYQYDYPEESIKQEKKKDKNSRKWLLCISMAIVFGIVASGVFYFTNQVLEQAFQQEAEVKKKKEDKQVVGNTQVTTTTTTDNNKELGSVSEVAVNVMPSVVSITNLSIQEVNNFFFGGTTIQEYESSGSGIIIGQNESELLIVSNNHVVEGSSTLTVFFVDGESVEAQIKGTDSDIDLAIIAVPLENVKDETLEKIKVATLGDSDALVVGEPTIAIGNALGYGQSVTTGIVSALGRQMEGLDTQLIQTDAAINPGNSGGALLNARGEVVGINTAKVSADAVEGMGYAIPISDVNDVINELMNRETRNKVPEDKRGALGISGVTVDQMTSQLYGIPQGVHVSEVIEDGAADKAGIESGSVIVKLDENKIKTMEDLTEQLEYYKAGEKVSVTVKVPTESGKYKEKTYTVKLSKKSILE